ncbi:MAG: hypothetical protein E7381_02520 [Clostridiales bacterium]|nr:hypothetical protein [Clostridiales bacterium]
MADELKTLFGLNEAIFLFDLLGENEECVLSKEGKWEEKIFVERNPYGYVVRRTVKNASSQTLRLGGLRLKIEGISLGEKRDDDYFYCNENARLLTQLTLPLDYNRLNDDAFENTKFALALDRRWSDVGVQEGRICSSPYQPLPAILLSNYKEKNGLVCGSLSQDQFCLSFEVGHRKGGAYLEAYSTFKDTAYREVQPQEELVDVLYLGDTSHADDINLLFEKYVNVLREILKNNNGAGETNRHTVIWGSWNDGIFRNVSEQMLLDEAVAVKKYFPTVEWFQLDDGYASFNKGEVGDWGAHGLGVAYEGESGIDYEKFPNGLKGYTDKIKALGLKPAIWIGGFCPVKTKIFKEHPGWFIDYNFRIDWTQPLDVSQSEVREYMCHALDVLLTDAGFEGIKHDFWSYAFEERHDLYKNKDKSGYEYREWWTREIRKRLPNGYLQTGCDISAGNPFLGKYFNNYRFGLDVSGGDWLERKFSMFWSVPVLSAHTGDLYIPNSDSIGLLPGLNDEDFLSTVNWQIITRSLVELSGRFSLVNEDNPRLKIIQRAIQYVNNGEPVYFANYDYRQKGMNVPEIIYIRSAFDCADDSYITVALFNSSEADKEIAFNPQDVGLSDTEHEVEFVWENKRQQYKRVAVFLKSHQSVLLKIKK